MNSLQSNIITLKQGGMISGIFLKPLPLAFSTSGILLMEIGIFTRHLLLKYYYHINRSNEQQLHQH